MTVSGSRHLFEGKLNPPTLPADFVPRSRLVERLTRRLTRQATLVAAPAGAGKSTLVAHWLQATGARAGWLNLDEHDSRLDLFLHHLLRAIETQFSSACPITRLLLQLPEPPPFSLIEANLINELADLPESFVLVLDNFHLIRAPQITRLVRLLIEYQPVTLHLVILARGEPQLPLRRLRARRQIAEIGTAELAFSAEEALAYLNLVTGVKVTPTTAAKLAERVEGWVMGLRLSASALREMGADGDPDLSPEAVSYKAHADYFSEHVLAGQPPDIRRFLAHIAILKGFCPPLCDALSRENDEIGASSRALIDQLNGSGSFIVPLDDRPGWYRLHGLFRETLLKLSEERVGRPGMAALHNRASAWLAENGFVEEAVQHALSAENPLAAVAIVEDRAPGALQREETEALDQWLQLLPRALIWQRPRLLIAQAWHQQLTDRRAPIEPLLSTAEDLLEKGKDAEKGSAPSPFRGEIAALRCSYCYWRGKLPEARDFATRALAQLPADSLATSHALGFFALTERPSADTSETGRGLVRTIQSRLTAAQYDPSPLLLAHAHSCLTSNQLNQLAIAAKSLLNYGLRLQRPLTIAWGHTYLGRLYYEWNRLDAACEHFSAVVDSEPPLCLQAHADSLLGLALVGHLDGDTEAAAEAVAALDALENLDATQAAAYKARMALAAGEAGAAISLAERTPVPDACAYPFAMENPLLTRIQALIAQDTRDSLAEAIHLLPSALRAAQNVHNMGNVVKALALRALTLAAQGRTETALDVLGHAVSMGRCGGLVRTFVDLGQPMATLLYDLAQKEQATGSYAERLLKAFTRGSELIHPLVIPANELLIEPLTERELEVLQMLYRRLSNVEIAQTLEISPLTVKKHTINIFQKLNVQSRQEAVNAGIRLGLVFDIR